jgi:hypothetical protein
MPSTIDTQVKKQALAANLCGSGFCERGSGISYPSPLSHYFGGDVLHNHHHGGSHHFHHSQPSFFSPLVNPLFSKPSAALSQSF